MESSSRLVLGTAQLGIDYGIANIIGKPDYFQAKSIIQKAWEKGIREYDTAQGYGESEKVLGNALRSLGISSEVRVITKLDPNIEHLDKAALEQAVRGSLTHLNIPILYGLMLHREEYLELWQKGLGEILQDFVLKGLTEHVGVSIYSPEKAMFALETEGISIVQIPSNILDRRFERAGVFEKAERKRKQIYVRSVFLQGLAVMRIEELPRHMEFAASVLRRIDSLCNDAGLTRQALSLGYVKEAYPNAKIIFGAESHEQVEENMVYWNESLPVDMVDRVKETFDNVEERILNPVFWKRG